MLINNQNKNLIIIGFLIITILCTQYYFKIENRRYDNSSHKVLVKPSREAKMTTIKERWNYMFNLTRDPKTNSIPQNIRAKELGYAKLLPKTQNRLNKSSLSQYQWTEVGPSDVGGRTRALAIDVNNTDRILAGGTSGGIWESTNNGDSWELKSSSTSLLSVTSLAQDPRNGHTDTWYYAAGEWRGSSANDRGSRARFTGNGIYKSTDNGITWNVLQNTTSDPTSFNSYSDYVHKIIVNPISGNVFIASAWYGILKSSNGGNSFSVSLGESRSHYSDIVVAGDGTLVATLSQLAYEGSQDNQPGIYLSKDDGNTWTNITPTNFPSSHERTVLAISESNPNIVYALTNTGNFDGDDEIIKLFRLDNSNSTSADLSANLPSFEGRGGKFDSQENYNMVINVKPDDDSFVLIGGTSLFRSTDGFSTKITNAKNDWIGGYEYISHPTSLYYPNQHPDQHALFFDKNNPNKLWCGHDGGLSYTTNITETNYSEFFPWIPKNNGYNVTQFYTVTIDDIAGDNKIMGGTQDNGTPHFQIVNGIPTSSSNLSSGDGSYAYYGDAFAYFSSQNGKVRRAVYDSDGNPYNMWIVAGNLSKWTHVHPRDASSQLFINPFVIDPNDENIMYYPAGEILWRNNALNSIPDYETPGTLSGWSELSNISIPAGYNITALNVTKGIPSYLLYYGASSSNSAPKLYKLSDANSATDGEVDISIPGAVGGAYIHDIAINPADGSEIIVVMSNYNIIGLYHSVDGGLNYVPIEGNLAGTSQNPGPSLRSAIIMPNVGTPKYLIGTSTGLYSTDILDGNNTVWSQESPNGIGNVVVEKLTARTSDNQIAVATHGRGLFIRPFSSLDVISDYEDKSSMQFALDQNYPNPFNPSTTISYTLLKDENVTLKVYNIKGKELETIINYKQNAGKYSVNWNRPNYPSGTYFYKLTTPSFTKTRKMVLLK
jgi:hypothetical protein